MCCSVACGRVMHRSLGPDSSVRRGLGSDDGVSWWRSATDQGIATWIVTISWRGSAIARETSRVTRARRPSWSSAPLVRMFPCFQARSEPGAGADQKWEIWSTPALRGSVVCCGSRRMKVEPRRSKRAEPALWSPARQAVSSVEAIVREPEGTVSSVAREEQPAEQRLRVHKRPRDPLLIFFFGLRGARAGRRGLPCVVCGQPVADLRELPIASALRCGVPLGRFGERAGPQPVDVGVPQRLGEGEADLRAFPAAVIGRNEGQGPL